MLGFKSFWAARCTIAGMEVMHTIRKGQLATTETMSYTPAEQFYALAALITESDNFTRLHLQFATKSRTWARTHGQPLTLEAMWCTLQESNVHRNIQVQTIEQLFGSKALEKRVA